MTKQMKSRPFWVAVVALTALADLDLVAAHGRGAGISHGKPAGRNGAAMQHVVISDRRPLPRRLSQRQHIRRDSIRPGHAVGQLPVERVGEIRPRAFAVPRREPVPTVLYWRASTSGTS